MSEIPLQDQLALWDAWSETLDASHAGTERRINRLLQGQQPDPPHYDYGPMRDALRQFLTELEPWLRDGTVEGGPEAWGSRELGAGDTWAGLRSIVRAEPGARIPRAVLSEAFVLAQELAAQVVDADVVEAGYGLPEGSLQ